MKIIEASMRTPTREFFQKSGIEVEEVARMNPMTLVDILIKYIMDGKTQRGIPWKPNTRKTYAYGIISYFNKLRNEKLDNLPAVKHWLKTLEVTASIADTNTAPQVDKTTICDRAQSLAPEHLKIPVKDLVHLQWATMARSTLALKGLALVGRDEDKWRFSWQQHKTQGVIGVRDIWLSDAEVGSYLAARLSSFATRTTSLYKPEVIEAAAVFINRALDGRSMSIRRSAAQKHMAHYNDPASTTAITLHTNTKTFQRYAATRPKDLRPPGTPYDY